MVLRMALRAPEPRRAGARRASACRLAGPPPGAHDAGARAACSPRRRRRSRAARSARSPRRRASASGVIDGLVDDGALETVGAAAGRRSRRRPDPDHADAALSTGAGAPPRRRCVATRRAPRRVLASTLLDGVTGSGKTEVYFEAVAEALRRGRQALILLPEIALTGAVPRPLRARASARGRRNGTPASAARRRERIWRGRGARRGARRGRRALGAVPAVPRTSACIVVDEEHEAAYKQEDGVRYHARDMAVVRGRLEGAPVVLASATPSIESRVNAERGRYRHVAPAGALRRPRAAGDRRDRPAHGRRPPRGRWLVAARSSRRSRETLARGRAGAALPQPPRLRAADAVPRLRPPLPVPELLGLAGRAPLPPRARLPPLRPCRAPARACPACGAADALARLRPGRRAHRRGGRRALFPERARAGAVVRLSRAAPSGCGASSTAVAAGEVDIVIGTQLVAKGHNFPQPDAGRRGRRRSRPRVAAIRAPPSAPSSCCSR